MPPRSNRGMRSSAVSALADLAARKASGKTRTADYEVQQEASIYETVDEATYAAIAAQKRKEARDFIASNDYDEHYGMEEEFDMEDQLSVVRPQRDRKRQRTSAPRVKKPSKPLASAFFNSFAPAPVPTEQGDANEAGVLDVSMLDAEFEKHVSSSRAARRRKKAVARSVGDMLFDAPAEPPLVSMQAPDPLLPIEPSDEYAAPPPTTANPDPVAAPSDAIPPPVQILEDSLDADALVAAAEAASSSKKRPLPQPVHSAKPPPKPVSTRPTPMASSVNLPIGREASGDVLMFWTDAHEVRVNGGQQLYLFGKVPLGDVKSGLFASVCVQVHGMERVLYVLPRKTLTGADGKPTQQPVKMIPDVHSEVTKVLLGNPNVNANRLGGAAALRSSNLPTAIKAKKAVRSCPFGHTEAPREPTEYLKFKLPYTNVCRMHPDSHGKTFSRVFGTRTNASEAFTLKRKLKGPCWIRLKNATPLQGKVSHAKFSLSVPNPEDVSVAMDRSNDDPPTFSALCVNIKTVINPKTGAHEIVLLAGVFIRDVPLTGPLHDAALEPGGVHGTRDFVLVRPPEGKSIPFGFSDRARSVLARGGGVEVVPNEPALLNNFLTRLLRLDPDVIVGHDIMGFGLDVLISRMNARRSREWSRLGRLIQRRDLTQVVKNNSSSQWFKSEAIAGRLVLDTYSHAKELLLKEKDYSLSALSKNVLAPAMQTENPFILPPSTDPMVVPKAFDVTESLCRLVSECSFEARTSGRLAAHLSVLPLTHQLTCISGNIWSHTLRGARAERIEYLLCHEFKLIGSKHGGGGAKAGDITAKLLLPDKLNKTERGKLAELHEKELAAAAPPPPPAEAHGYGGDENIQTPDSKSKSGVVPKSGGTTGKKSKSARRKPQYSGGLVLEPRKGLYDRYVLQLDFNSLYPSIIQEFNICFTTLPLNQGKADPADPGTPAAGSNNPTGTPSLALPSKSVLEGVLPRVLRRLVESRRQVKKLLKEERQKAGKETLRAQQLDIRQLAIKLTANSLYGCLGFEGSRFFARPLAEMVTFQGRDTLQKTVDLARDSFNAQVIYGDTDSLFVYTGLEDIAQVRRLGAELKRDVNKKYRTLEIEIDAIYKKMLLLKKKKYAALKVIDPANPDKTVREVKGLDLVRHDWCDLSHDATEHFLTQIFRGKSSNIDEAVGNILSFLSDLAIKVNGNQFALSKYVITRALTKRPQDYPDGSSLPHVTVAVRLINEEKRRIKPGDYIKYVVCKSDSSRSSSIAARSYHPDEVMASKGKLVIDVQYYLENQILPPLMRMCDPIESIEASRVAVSLGLDGRRYERRNDEDFDNNNYLAIGSQSAEEKFRDVEHFLIKCRRCGETTDFRGVIFKSGGQALKSSGLECVKCHARFSSSYLKNALSLITRKWIGQYYTTPLVLDADDGSRKRDTRNVGLGGTGSLLKRKWDESWLYRQLRYLHFLMDVQGRWRELTGHDTEKIPVSRPDQAVYDQLLDHVDRCFDNNAYRFVDLASFLAPLGIS